MMLVKVQLCNFTQILIQMSAQIQITKGTFENLIPSYWSLCTFLNRKATNKVFGILLTLYLSALGFLASLPSIDPKALPKRGEADIDSKTEIAKSLFDILRYAGPERTLLHVSLIASITLSIIMAQLCKFEDAYFKGEESSWPFRSLSISPFPVFWWIYFEFPEKSLMMATIFQYWTSFNKITKNEFQDYTRFSPLSNKWEALRFLLTFSLFTVLLGVLKIIFMRFTGSHLMLEPSLPPLGLSKVSDETWMNSAPSTSTKTSKTKSKKSLKSNQNVKKRK
jgi:hypothetical protein